MLLVMRDWLDFRFLDSVVHVEDQTPREFVRLGYGCNFSIFLALTRSNEARSLSLSNISFEFGYYRLLLL